MLINELCLFLTQELYRNSELSALFNCSIYSLIWTSRRYF